MSKESRASSASGGGDGGSSAASLTTVASLTVPSSGRSVTATNTSSKGVFESYAKYCGIALAAIVVVGIVFFLVRSGVHTLNDQATFLHNSVNQAQEWNLVSEKASKPVEKLVASTRALAFLNAARMSVKDDEIENTLRVDIAKLVKRLEKKQVTAIVEFDQTAAHFASVSVIR